MRLIINTLLVILVIHYILTEVNLQITLPIRSMFTPSLRGYEYYKNKSSKKRAEAPSSTSTTAPAPTPANDTQQEQQEQQQMMEEMANYESSMPNKRMFNNETRDGTGDYRIDRYYEPGIGGIKEGNYYTTYYNTPNFDSNIMDTPSYYKENAPSSMEQFVSMDSLTTPQKSCYYDTKSDSVAQSQWIYADEKTMNGGKLYNNVTGFDTLPSDYAVYDTLGKYGCNMQTLDHTLKNDDIRMGLGIPNDYYQATN